MKKRLLLDAAVRVNQDLYFTSKNTHSLYKFSIDTGIINAVATMATKSARAKKFASMVFYQDKIWMLPWSEDYIWIYDINEKKIRHLEVPISFRKNSKGAIFRRCICVDKFIWAVPNWTACIMKIDMEQESFSLYNKWPEGVIVSLDDPNFKCVSYDSGKLYLLRDRCNENIVFDIETGCIKIAHWPVEGEFGCVKNGRIVIAPVKNGNPLRIYKTVDDTNAILECEIELPDDIWVEEELYAFWYVDYLDGKWIILPHEAKAILVLDEDLNLQIIKFSDYGLKSSFAAYETIKIEDRIYILPYEGEEILIMDAKNNITDWIKLEISISEDTDELNGLFDEVLDRANGKWKNGDMQDDCRSFQFNDKGKEIYLTVKE